MTSHYGVAVIPDAHKNAVNVILALIADPPENPALSENVSQPLNATGSPNDPVTHWMGGRPYSAAQLEVYQALPDNIPAASWPVTGVTGAASEADAVAAAAAMTLHVTTQETYTTQQAQQTLAAVLTAMGLKRVVEE